MSEKERDDRILKTLPQASLPPLLLWVILWVLVIAGFLFIAVPPMMGRDEPIIVLGGVLIILATFSLTYVFGLVLPALARKCKRLETEIEELKTNNASGDTANKGMNADQ